MPAATLGPRVSATGGDWLQPALASIRRDGFAIVEDVLDAATLARTRDAMYRARDAIVADVGAARLARAGELGVLRLMMRYDAHFIELLANGDVLAVVDASLSPTAILHLQNGFVLPPAGDRAAGEHFQTTFHRDFPRHMGGYVASINTLLAIDDFTAANGATLLVPGSHQCADVPDRERLRAAIPALCPAGSMLAFDSTLWHAAGANRSGRDRLAINQQFTRSFIKPQIDYVRALGDEIVQRQPPRTQQLLGWYTRVVTSLDEYYRPAGERLYRGGQG